MAICKTCGVDLGEGIDYCPLCGAEEKPIDVISPADVLNLSKKENIKQLYELTVLLLVSAIIITVAIDAVFGKGLSWSFLTTACLGFIIAFVSIIRFLKAHPYWLIGSAMVSTLLLLFFVDLVTGNKGWFIDLAGPIAASAFILSALVIFLNSLSRYKGLNLIATILLALAVFVVIIELFADRVMTGTCKLQWSVVTAASLAILAMILIFVHYRLKRGRSLGRLFHI